MKRLLTLLAVFALATATFAQNNTIAVPAPKTMNIGEGNEWIPLFIQGVITTNFQNYSGMKVVDRQNSDMVKAEQRLSENAEFSDADAIEMGKMTHAHLIVTGSITGKASSYALMFSITDAETGETKASATVPNCLFSALENGDAANQISYDLMTGYGINLSAEAKKKLTQKASVMTAENTAQASVAKGIVAENSGSNIEALTYYIQAKKNDKKLSEATSRMANMSTVVSTGNFGKNAKNMIKLRNDWDKLLRETTALIASNPPVFELVYFSDITSGDIDYDKGTMSLYTRAPYIQLSNLEEFSENKKLVKEMKATLKKISDSANWGKKINDFPWSYADDVGGNNWLQTINNINYEEIEVRDNKDVYDYEIERYLNKRKDFVYKFDFSLLNSSKKEIGKSEVVYFVIPPLRRCFFDDYKRGFVYEDFATHYAYFRSYEGKRYLCIAYQQGEGKEKGHDYKGDNGLKLNFNSVSVDDADTDKMFISVKNTNNKDISIVPIEKVEERERAKRLAEEQRIKEARRLAEEEAKAKTFVYTGDKKATTITIPDGYETIAENCFKNCKKLKNIVIPASITVIGKDAFVGCGSLKTINYRGTLEYFLSNVEPEDMLTYRQIWPVYSEEYTGRTIKNKKIKWTYNYTGE